MNPKIYFGFQDVFCNKKPIYNVLFFSKEPPSLLHLAVYLFFGSIIVVYTLFSAHFGFCWENNWERKEYAMHWYAEVPVPQVIYGLNVSFGDLRGCEEFLVSTF